MVSEDSLGLVKPPFAGHPPTCWLHYWVMNLADLDCRLPPDLKPQTMGAVLEVFLHQFDLMDTSTEVCTACGLRLPTHKSPPYNEWRLLPGKTPMVGDPPWYDLPEFFRGCPHCGTKDMMWRHRTREFQYPWRTLAVTELDSVD